MKANQSLTNPGTGSSTRYKKNKQESLEPYNGGSVPAAQTKDPPTPAEIQLRSMDSDKKQAFSRNDEAQSTFNDGMSLRSRSDSPQMRYMKDANKSINFQIQETGAHDQPVFKMARNAEMTLPEQKNKPKSIVNKPIPGKLLKEKVLR